MEWRKWVEFRAKAVAILALAVRLLGVASVSEALVRKAGHLALVEAPMVSLCVGRLASQSAHFVAQKALSGALERKACFLCATLT